MFAPQAADIHSRNLSKWNLGKVKIKPMLSFSRIRWGSREVCRGILLCAFAGFCTTSLLACFSLPPSVPPTHFSKYQFHTLVLLFQCCVDRCLEVGYGLVAMVTLLLRRLLPSSFATFTAPTLQYSIGLEFNYYFTMFHICRTMTFPLHQVKLCIGQRKYKQKFMTQGGKEGRIDWLTEPTTKRVNSHSLT